MRVGVRELCERLINGKIAELRTSPTDFNNND